MDLQLNRKKPPIRKNMNGKRFNGEEQRKNSTGSPTNV